jgi:hypothetical protein
MSDIKKLNDHDVERGLKYFKQCIKDDTVDSLFKPSDIMIFNIDSKLVQFTKKEIIQEGIRREVDRRKKAIINKLKRI